MSSTLALSSANEKMRTYEHFIGYLQEVETVCQEQCFNNADRKALRYGVICQLCNLALHAESSTSRAASIDRLAQLSETWSENRNIEADLRFLLLDGIATVAQHSRHDVDRTKASKVLGDWAEAIADLSTTSEVRIPLLHLDINFLYSAAFRGDHSHVGNEISKLSQRINQLPKTWHILLGWLGIMPGITPRDGRDEILYIDQVPSKLQQKLANFSKLESSPILGKFYNVVEERLACDPSSIVSQERLQAEFRAQYKHTNFKDEEPFLGILPVPIDKMDCHLELELAPGETVEAKGQAQRIRRSVSYQDLYAKEVDRVLLVGEAGTGKTSLTKKIAHDWAVGRWGHKFHVVYVLPIKTLTENTLATAIATQYFRAREEKEFKDFRERIHASLGKPTTLVILDGLDEQAGAVSEKVLEESVRQRHALLLTSRPYGVKAHERTLVKVNHMGLSKEQRDNFVEYALGGDGPNTAEKLLKFITANKLEEMSRVPVNLKILCALWKQKRHAIIGRKAPIGLPSLYRDLADYVWDRFQQKFKDKAGKEYAEEERKDKLFKDLEKIALASLKVKETIISPITVKDALSGETDHSLFQNTGFLLFEQVAGQYQFPHLTFHEYFAGRRLARLFLSDKQEKAVAAFLKGHMYESQYRRTLPFMAGEVSKGMFKEARSQTPRDEENIELIQSLLELVNSVSQKQTSVRHLVLQLSLLNEWLLIVRHRGEDIGKALSLLDTEFKLGDELNTFLKKGLESPEDGDEQESLNELLRLLTEASAVATHYGSQIQPLIEQALLSNDASVRRSAVRMLPALVLEAKDITTVFSHCRRALIDLSASVREEACKTFSKLTDQGAILEAEQLSSLFYTCVINGYLNSVEFLTKQGAQIDTYDEAGLMSIHVAAQNAHAHIVEFLLAQGVKVDTCSKDNATSLHMAASKGHLAVVKCLRVAGAQLSAVNNDGRTPMHLAAQNGHLAVVQYLDKNGAKLGARDSNGFTAFYLASSAGHASVKDYLLQRVIDKRYADLVKAMDEGKVQEVNEVIASLSQLIDKVEKRTETAKRYIDQLTKDRSSAWCDTSRGRSVISKLELLAQECAYALLLKDPVQEFTISKSSQNRAKLIDILLQLASLHQEQGKALGDLSYYTDAATCYQHVLSVCGEENVATGYALQTNSAYEGLLAISKALVPTSSVDEIVKIQEEIAGDKQELEGLRVYAQVEAEELETLLNQRSTPEEERANEAVYIQRSKELFHDIATQVKAFLARLYLESEQELGPAPCKYTVMGLGSMALQQMTPYSDLEFAILIEECTNEVAARAYFKQLTHLVNFRVINLGETKIPNSKHGVNLEHLIKRGINLDLAGLTPLGRKDKPYTLIQTVAGMLHYLRNENNQVEHINKNLPYILESTCYVHGDEQLHKAYEAQKVAFLSDPVISRSRAMTRMLDGVVEWDYIHPGIVGPKLKQLGNI
ncbi:MAG: ankyrin repeat domain-containing protein, partial [Bacteroidota bacterium]